eukprot:7389289-Prymnesium_polylepis.2
MPDKGCTTRRQPRHNVLRSLHAGVRCAAQGGGGGAPSGEASTRTVVLVSRLSWSLTSSIGANRSASRQLTASNAAQLEDKLSRQGRAPQNAARRKKPRAAKVVRAVQWLLGGGGAAMSHGCSQALRAPPDPSQDTAALSGPRAVLHSPSEGRVRCRTAV